MKKLLAFFAASVIGISSVYSAPVSATSAQKVASGFFAQISNVTISQVTLVYTETDPSNNPLYYVFNINTQDGFVIVSADDVLHPIMGYSTEKRPYAIPKSGTAIDYWMQQRKTEIINDVANHVTATANISNEWTSYANNVRIINNANTSRVLNTLFPSNSSFLVQSTWDQPGPYNDDCPGTGSNQAVTGCVATTMCQLMRYWNYPAVGTGSSSYADSYYSTTLSANYHHPYPWSIMPLSNPSGSDTALPRAMSDAGISVQMDYSPTGSGAEVITSDDPQACAQISFVTYFRYSAHILDGRREFHDTVAWQDTIKHELDRSRPVEYVGEDPSAGGHTWVCDGYDAINFFHMNWGWSGYCDGWYSIANLNPTGYNFSHYEEALIGIMPPPVTAKPTAAFVASGRTACTNNSVQFMDTSTNQPNSWSWTFTGGSPSTSTAQDPLISYSAPGTYSVKLVVSNSFGSDSATYTSFITVNQAPAAPTITQSGSILYATPSNYPHYQWYRNNTLLVGQTSSQLSLTNTGVYTVDITDNNGCTGSGTLLITKVLGINNITAAEDNVSIYPNPTDGNVKVELNLAAEGDYTIAVSNILGQTLYTNNINLTGPYSGNINLANYGKGLYFISITGNNSMVVKKVVVY